MRRPARFVIAAPILHSFRVVQNLSVAGIQCEVRFTSHDTLDSCSIVTATLPTAIGALSFSPLRMAAMKLAKCAISHGVAAQSVSEEVGGLAGLDFGSFVALQIVDLVAAAVHNHRPRGSHDARAAIAPVEPHPLAAFSLPLNHLVCRIRSSSAACRKTASHP